MRVQWVVLVLLLIPVAFGTGNITTAETVIEMHDGKVAVQSDVMLVTEEPIGNLTLILAQNPRDVRVLIDQQPRNCLLQAEFARCGDLGSGGHTINISYETSYPIAVVGDNTLFRYTDRLPYPAAAQQVTLKLPVGFIIPRERGKDESFYITPKPTDVYSDGQRIIIFWEQTGQEMAISVVARRVVGPPVVWMVLSIVAIAITFVLSIWFVIREQKTKKPRKTKKPAVIPGLMESEQKVVDFLRTKGEAWQKQIQLSTGFSKAKVSRVVRNLEARGVVSKTPYGNTNKVALKVR